MTLNIAQIVYCIPPFYYSGMGRACFELSHHLAKLGEKVTLYFVFHKNVNLSIKCGKGTINIQGLKPLMKYRNSSLTPSFINLPYENYDIVHLHYPFYLDSDIVYLAHLMKKFPYVITYHMDGELS